MTKRDRKCWNSANLCLYSQEVYKLWKPYIHSNSFASELRGIFRIFCLKNQRQNVHFRGIMCLRNTKCAFEFQRQKNFKYASYFKGTIFRVSGEFWKAISREFYKFGEFCVFLVAFTILTVLANQFRNQSYRIDHGRFYHIQTSILKNIKWKRKNDSWFRELGEISCWWRKWRWNNIRKWMHCAINGTDFEHTTGEEIILKKNC